MLVRVVRQERVLRKYSTTAEASTSGNARSKNSPDEQFKTKKERVPRFYCKMLTSSTTTSSSSSTNPSSTLQHEDDDAQQLDHLQGTVHLNLHEKQQVSVIPLDSETTFRRQIAALRAACFD
ncbi:unnamed protein product, partial [Amoebophrya sp. A25]|eukprot:GSA25T00016927001.1